MATWSNGPAKIQGVEFVELLVKRAPVPDLMQLSISTGVTFKSKTANQSSFGSISSSNVSDRSLKLLLELIGSIEQDFVDAMFDGEPSQKQPPTTDSVEHDTPVQPDDVPGL